MNREVLINSLEEFMEETDARLTALEAAKPQAPAASCDEMLDTLLLSNADKRAAIANLIAENKRLEERYNNLLNSPMPGAEAPKPNERDWEAAANSALAQLKFARKNAGWLRDTLDTAQDKIERLLAENQRLTDGFYALEAQRNTLAAQVDDLRNVNAGLRADNDTLRKDNDAHRANYVNRESALKNQRGVICALRADNELLTDAATGLADDVIVLTEKTRLMKAALQMVEWVRDDFGEYSECPWCREDEDTNHNPSCPRQAALR